MLLSSLRQSLSALKAPWKSVPSLTVPLRHFLTSAVQSDPQPWLPHPDFKRAFKLLSSPVDLPDALAKRLYRRPVLSFPYFHRNWPFQEMPPPVCGSDINYRLPDNSRKFASVVLFMHPNTEGTGVSAVVMRRSEGIRHPNQYALPGGRFEPGRDGNLLQAAMRESYEEIGFSPDTRIRLLGNLPPQTTVTGFWVVPWVVWTDEPPEILVNQPEEVAWVMSVEASRFASLGLNLVSNIKHPKLKGYTGPSFDISDAVSVVDGTQSLPNKIIIWGLSARIILSMMCYLEGRQRDTLFQSVCEPGYREKFSGYDLRRPAMSGLDQADKCP